MNDSMTPDTRTTENPEPRTATTLRSINRELVLLVEALATLALVVTDAVEANKPIRERRRA